MKIENLKLVEEWLNEGRYRQKYALKMTRSKMPSENRSLGTKNMLGLMGSRRAREENFSVFSIEKCSRSPAGEGHHKMG